MQQAARVSDLTAYVYLGRRIEFGPNIKTGAVLGAPAPRGVASYPVRVQGADVEVEV